MSHAARYLALRVLVGACGKQSVHHLHVSILGGKHRGSPALYLVLRVLAGACGKQSVHLHVSISGGKHHGSLTVLKARPRTTRQHGC